MHFFNLIVTGVILMNRQTYYDIVSCQGVSIVTGRYVNYKEDKLKFACSPIQVSMWKGVTNIRLSKNTSTGFQDIIMVYLNIKTLRNETVWTQQGWQQRAIIIKEYVNPLINPGLEFDIRPENVLCSDEGTFRCNAIGSSNMNELIEREVIAPVKLLVKPTTINQIEVSPKPEIDELYKPNTLIELSCTGTVGRNPVGILRWCYRRDDMLNFIGWQNPDDYDQGMLVPLDCQNSRTSTLRYNVSADYKYTEFRCETGGTTTICGHPSAIASNITINRYSEPIHPTTSTSVCSSDMNTILIACIAILMALIIVGFTVSVLLIKRGIIVIKWRKERMYGDTKAKTTTEHVYDTTTEYHIYYTAEG